MPVLKSLSITIAGITIRVDSDIDLNHFRDINLYKDFNARNGLCQCRLDLKIGTAPFRFKGYTYNPAGNWRLLDLKGKHIVQVGFPYGKGRPEEVVIFNSHYTRGIVYKKYVLELFRGFLDQFILINLLSQNQGFLIHAAGCIFQNKGLCFVGRAGSGKSTLLKLLSSEMQEKDVLNDDRLAIRNYRHKWFISGTPWHGEVPLASPVMAELKALFFIGHSPRNYRKRLSPPFIFQQLIRHSLLPFWDKSAMLKVLDVLKVVAFRVPAFELGFLPDKRAVDLIKEAV